MNWIVFAVLLLSLLFSFVVFLGGPPYLPTLSKNVQIALDMLDLKEGQTLLELGSGDGRVMLEAAKRGATVVGIELNPVFVVVSRLRTWKYRKRVRVIWGNYFGRAWPPADAIFTFMLARQMSKLDTRIERWRSDRQVRLASFAFPIPEKEPTATRDGVFLYEYKGR